MLKLDDKVLLKGELPRAHPTRGTVYTVRGLWYKNPDSNPITDRNEEGRIMKALLWQDDNRREEVVNDLIDKIVPVPRWFKPGSNEVAYILGSNGVGPVKLVADFCAIWYDDKYKQVLALVRCGGDDRPVIATDRELKLGHLVMGPDGRRRVRDGPSPQVDT